MPSAFICVFLFLLKVVAESKASVEFDNRPVSNGPQRLCGADGEPSEEACSDVNHVLTASDTDFPVDYFLYKRDSRNFLHQFNISNNLHTILKANPDRDAPWKVLVHGFNSNGHAAFPVNVRDAYITYLEKHPEENLNILVFDWRQGAYLGWGVNVANWHTTYYNAVNSVKTAGEKLGNMLVWLIEKGFIPKNDDLYSVHFVGHSLGSHVSWYAARQVFNRKQVLTKRISALGTNYPGDRQKNKKGPSPYIVVVTRVILTSSLDPAGPYFSRLSMFSTIQDPFPRIHRNKVAFLDVYHTSQKYGLQEEVGDVDFYINGGGVQPECYWYRGNIQPDVCSHSFAPKLFAKSINNDTMIACTGCDNYEHYRNKHCKCDDDPIVGEFVVKKTIDGYPTASGEAFYDIDEYL